MQPFGTKKSHNLSTQKNQAISWRKKNQRSQGNQGSQGNKGNHGDQSNQGNQGNQCS